MSFPLQSVKAALDCRAPIDWETPSGKRAQVNLELQLSAFTGYGKADEDAYLGLQAHGILWVADPTQTPVNWPIAPPIVAGKVLSHSTCMPANACSMPTQSQPHGPVRGRMALEV